MPHNHLYKNIFNTNGSDTGETLMLENLVKEYPYFSVAHFFLLQHSNAASANYNSIAAKTALHFNNPFLLQEQLQKTEDHDYEEEEIIKEVATVSENTDEDELLKAAENVAIPETVEANESVENETYASANDEHVEEETFAPLAEHAVIAEAVEVNETSAHENYAYTPEKIEDAILENEIVESETYSSLNDEQVEEESFAPLTEEEVMPETVEATDTAPQEIHAYLTEKIEDAIIENEIAANEPSAYVDDALVKEEVSAPVIEDEIIPEKIKANETVTQENHADVPEKIEDTGVENKSSLNKEEALIFEPLFATDYFASQGIKLSEEVMPSDKLGKQLKSFTEWLKTMKKVHESKLPAGNEALDMSVQTLAEKSNLEEDVITETMAEVFLQQGKLHKAKEIYEKLSLLNPSKNAYFAAKIEQII